MEVLKDTLRPQDQRDLDASVGRAGAGDDPVTDDTAVRVLLSPILRRVEVPGGVATKTSRR
jgi:hypothetical protein